MPILPWQGVRLAEALRQQHDKADREKRKHAPFDGDGKYIEDVEIDASSTKDVYHGLGRRVRGWMLISPSYDGTADGMVKEVSSSTEILELGNDATSSVTFGLWVF